MGSYPKDADGQALQRVEDSGNDMGKPMSVDFFVAIPSQDAGNSVAMAASTVGYNVSVEYDEEDDSWTCYCAKTMVPRYSEVIACQEELDVLSKPYGGQTDGWGTYGNKD